MKQDLSLVLHRRFGVLRGFLLLIMIAGLSGCSILPTTNQETKPKFCAPAPEENLYQSASRSWSDLVVAYAFSSSIPASPNSTPAPLLTPSPTQLNEQQLPSARYAAFRYLMDETKRWSDVQTVKLDDANEAQIIITLISPEILQAVFLSEFLKDRLVTADFQTQNQNMLNSIAERNELLFLLTVTITNTNLTRHTIKIPVGNLILNTSENSEINTTHDDHNLEQPLNSADGPIFGYFAYPLARIVNEKCKLILDPKFDTNIVISVASIEVDVNNKSGPYSWVFPYKPLINSISSSVIPDFNMPLGFDQNLMTPLQTSPSNINQTNNWQDYARFLWYQVTMGDY